MGWTFTQRDRGISHLGWFSREFNSETFEVIDSAAVGFNQVYLAARIPAGVLGVAVMTSWRTKDWSNFGYKEMEEGSGPGLTACPERILRRLSPLRDLYGPGTSSYEWAGEWRDRCWQRISARAARPKPAAGDRLKFADRLRFAGVPDSACREFVLQDARRGVFIAQPAGVRVRITRWRDRDYEIAARAQAA